ncbi:MULTISPECIES: hypothetical protein [unclassified Mucilaginibacter]|uniref:hypothetical protein n=1 Tax=unclassified Mucilaginibacter TaxID=2617802 RepID=UPI00096357F2|nr:MULTISPECIES: hypothetical protein [unclassified Mucilaginibacter]OJW16990.1 MAG: hypothetical protein BGO48_11120 [Mucilaginibacter sp. 44-25]PLW88670.1 MAG: hypothetical protein C0154_15505 [Mucilaginibacter sp.]HEK21643.1 hypothetical protein [Bacteroidota bacterium]
MRYRYIILLFCLCISVPGFAQELSTVSRKLTNNISETYHVLASDGITRQGIYQALYKKKTAIASGSYLGSKRVGIWHFYDNNGTVVQSFNFDKQLLLYEAPEDTTSNLHYFIDRTLDTAKTAVQKITKPVRIGGRYYGYVPYVALFRMPKRISESDFDYSNMKAVVELLVSPGGRLADYTVHLIYVPTAYAVDDITMNLKLPNPDDLVFVPATFNGEPIACRVMIECIINKNGTLDFAR